MKDDPIRAKRSRIKRLTVVAKRVGYLLLLLSILVVGVGAVGRFTTTIAISATVLMFVALALLLPAILLGYAVTKAEREDPVRVNNS